MRIQFLLMLACCLNLGIAAAQSGTYPKPQVPSAAGKPAPAFTLKDQDGAGFSLSEQRGTWILVYFYRGYW
jgi:cytochrome oxidase Cu insertion factor (SCO1/SenC/PrrC family)